MNQVSGTTPRWKIAGVCALLAALVFALYGQTLRFDFVNYDDQFYVAKNFDVKLGLSPASVAWAFTHRMSGLWTPLVAISHMLDCQIFGLWAGGHHLANVLLHTASAILLFLVLRSMTGSLWRSAFVAAIFAIHPLRVESVAWISERKDTLSGLFFMLTLAAYLGYARRSGSWGRYACVIILFGCGLMSKPMLVTTPLVLLLLDYWPLNRLFVATSPNSAGGPRIHWRVLIEKIPMLALSAALGVTMMIKRKFDAPYADFSSIDPIPMWDRIREAPVWVITYIGQMFCPTHLSVIYTHPEQALQWWLPSFALVLLITAGCYLFREKHPWLLTGWLWNLVMLAPVLGILQISRHERADHYNYLPQIGLYIALVWLAAEWAGERKSRRIVLAVAAGVSLMAFLPVTWRQTSTWRDNITLWKHTLDCTRDNYIAHNDLGEALLGRDEIPAATVQFRESLRIHPENPQARNNYGVALCRQGRVDEGIAEFREALRINRFSIDAHCNLGNALEMQGHTDQAIAQYREALSIDSRDLNSLKNIAPLLEKNATTEDEAAECWRRILLLTPGDAVTQNHLAWLLATASQASLRNGPEAVSLANQAVRTSGGSEPDPLETLAAAYAQSGDFSKALETARKALQLAEARSDKALAESLSKEIKLYEGGQTLSAPH